MSTSQKIYYLEIALKAMDSLDKKNNKRLSVQILHTLTREYKNGKQDGNLIWLEEIYSQVDHCLRLPGSTFSIEINKLKN